MGPSPSDGVVSTSSTVASRASAARSSRFSRLAAALAFLARSRWSFVKLVRCVAIPVSPFPASLEARGPKPVLQAPNSAHDLFQRTRQTTGQMAGQIRQRRAGHPAAHHDPTVDSGQTPVFPDPAMLEQPHEYRGEHPL